VGQGQFALCRIVGSWWTATVAVTHLFTTFIVSVVCLVHVLRVRLLSQVLLLAETGWEPQQHSYAAVAAAADSEHGEQLHGSPTEPHFLTLLHALTVGGTCAPADSSSHTAAPAQQQRPLERSLPCLGTAVAPPSPPAAAFMAAVCF